MKPPTLDQLEAYIKLRNLSVNPRQFIMHYEDSDPPWTNDGKPVKNWKLTAQSWHFNNLRRGETYKCYCGAVGVYTAGKDDTGQVAWRCIDHKPTQKPIVSPQQASRLLNVVKFEKVNVNNERNRQTKDLMD